MALVDKGSGLEIDAVATVDWPHEAVAICNILNVDDGREALSGLWVSLPASVKANLEKVQEERVGEADGRYPLASLFITELDIPELPDPDAFIDWAKLFPVAQCPPGGCDWCEGCPGHSKSRGDGEVVNQCAPGGSCSCQSEDLEGDLDDCMCGLWDVGPRWAAAIYKSLAEISEVIVSHAEDLMWGVEGPAVGFPRSLVAQAPQFYLRLAQTCMDLCKELESGRVPVPHTIAELIMLDEAARSYLEGRTGGDGLDRDAMEKEMGHLPEAHGDFEMDALWMFQFTDSDWIDIVEADTVFDPHTMDRVFDTLPEAKDWPRPQHA
ncbi:hypothetical protein [Thermomonospora echinospora]|nr:hypothetical protein [Thermomonospora echinospora]